MKKIQTSNQLTAIVFVLIFFNLNIAGQEIQIATAEKPFTFKLTNNADDQLIEPSAIEIVDNDGKFLLVADDKSDEHHPNLRIIRASDGTLVKPLFKIPNTPEKPKWEALAKDQEGFFYLIGSHAAKDKDDADKLLARSHLYRFKLKTNEDPSKIEFDSSFPIIEFDIKPDLKDLHIYTAQPSEKNVKIEGLAVKTSGGKKQLIFGFREPSSVVETYSAELPRETEIKDSFIKLSLKPYFQFDAQTTKDKTRLKLSSIEYAQNWKGFLILTSSETTEKAANGKDKPVFHGNAIWFVSDEQIKATNFEQVKAQKISEAKFESSMKAEGLCLMPTANKKIIRLALVFDNDTEDVQKAAPDKFLPGMMQFVELSRKSP